MYSTYMIEGYQRNVLSNDICFATEQNWRCIYSSFVFIYLISGREIE